MKEQEFIDTIKQGAIDGYRGYGILPSISIAQAILESGWGSSELALKANNLFGIKAKEDWKGETYTVRTAEYDKNNRKFYINAPFRKYGSWTDSVKDHSKFFTSTPWRKENYKSFLEAKDYRSAAQELQKAGYATSQEYAKQLIDLIERYHLDAYDSEKKGDNNMRIFLSVGHSILRGGGCTSASGYVNEYRYNKALAPYVKAELERLGHTCDVIICPENQFRNWKGERSYKLPIANSGKYDLVCELHLNASNGKGYGMECLYYPGDAEGRAIAERGCANFSDLGFRNRGAKERGDLYIIGATKPTAVLFESFFCDNKGDCDLANELGYRKIAEAIATGLVGGSVSKPTVSSKPQPQQKEGQYFVLTSTPNDVLNVRERPDYRSKLVSSYRDGSKIYVHEVVHTSDSTWYKIEYHDGVFGYVNAKFCKGM